MVSYGLTKSIGSELSANDYEKGPNSSTQTPSKSASSAQIASLKSSATTNKIPLMYSTSPGNSPSSISSKTATPQARIMNNTASLSPSKALEMVSAEVSRRQENFHSLIQEKYGFVFSHRPIGGLKLIEYLKIYNIMIIR
jgi:hypothetical protein